MNRIDVEKQNVCDFQNGSLRSVDFSRLYSLSRNEKGVSRLTAYAENCNLRLTTRDRPADLSGLLALLLAGLRGRSDLPMPRSGLSLVRSSRPPAAVSLPPIASPSGLEKRKSEANINFRELPKKKTYSVETSRGFSPSGKAGDRLEMELPFGMPRYVNARTLKAMLGASSQDLLFRKVGERWQVCADSFEVDLQDRSQVFRLGEVQIFS